jgi:hypothetical protein
MNFEIAPIETETQLCWEDAKLYCFSLNIDGKTGWRLPTKDELNEIYHSENDFNDWHYWSSTEYVVSYAWNQNFDGGGQFTNGKYNGGYYVRAVRSIH